MKKKTVILFIGLLLAIGSMAQNSRSGIKAGLNLSSMSTDGNSDKNLNAGFHAGVFTKIALNNVFAIQPELLYSAKGLKLNYDESTIADGETLFNLNYIEVPVKFVFNLSEDFEFQFGPYIGYLIGANVDTDADVLNFFQIDSEDELNRKNFHSMDYGLSAGLGFDFDPLILGINYNLGIAPVAKDDEPSYDLLGDAKNTTIQLYAGLKF